MAEPPRDAEGNILPYDDPDIRGDDGLFRRIDPDNHVIMDRNMGCRRLSSAAFSESSRVPGGMSVDVERCMQAHGLDPLDDIPEDWGLVRLVTEDLRADGHKVGSHRLPDRPCHAEVWKKTPKLGGKIKTRSVTWVRKARGIP